jgi:hypothetical protein
MSRALTLALALLAVAPARAEPWTRDAGSFYLEASGTRLATRTLYLADFTPYTFCVTGDCLYVQQQIDLYAEVGVIDRWLTLTAGGTVFRDNDLEQSGRTEGNGDARVGAWSGLVTAPVHIALGVTLGIPLGDPSPNAGANADAVATRVARALPTGDGEWNLDVRLAIGERWGEGDFPLRQSLAVEAGVWLRTGGYADSLVYRVELDTRLRYALFERFCLGLHVIGVESDASPPQLDASATPFGLGNGVSYTAIGGFLSARVWRGLAIAVALDDTVRGRALPDATQLRVALSYDR